MLEGQRQSKRGQEDNGQANRAERLDGEEKAACGAWFRLETSRVEFGRLVDGVVGVEEAPRQASKVVQSENRQAVEEQIV